MKRIIVTLSVCFLAFFIMHAQEPIKVKISIGASLFVATFYDNATAKAFAEMFPMTIAMNELNGNEKYHFLSSNLPASPENPTTIHNGDLMLYGSNCIVLFYETFNTSYSYTKIGAVDNPSGLKAALGTNNATVRFELDGNTTGVNPIQSSNDDFKISSDGILQYNGNSKTVSILDLYGRTMLSSTSRMLNLNSFSRGFYFLKIVSQEQNKTRIIKFKY